MNKLFAALAAAFFVSGAQAQECLTVEMLDELLKGEGGRPTVIGTLAETRNA